MSHVFEHLYNPREFVENIHLSNVNSVYISIPNMIKSIVMCLSNILHNEHTFYIDKILIEWLFSQYGYFITDYYEFKNHSLFFRFQKTSGIEPKKLQKRPEIVEKINNIFMTDCSRLRDIIIKPNSYLIPAGLYGQFLFYFSPKNNILGYIDNDDTKHNKRVYGTPYYVHPFNQLLKHESCTVYILAGPYKDEIVKQIKSYDKDIEIIEL